MVTGIDFSPHNSNQNCREFVFLQEPEPVFPAVVCACDVSGWLPSLVLFIAFCKFSIISLFA